MRDQNVNIYFAKRYHIVIYIMHFREKNIVEAICHSNTYVVYSRNLPPLGPAMNIHPLTHLQI